MRSGVIFTLPLSGRESPAGRVCAVSPPLSPGRPPRSPGPWAREARRSRFSPIPSLAQPGRPSFGGADTAAEPLAGEARAVPVRSEVPVQLERERPRCSPAVVGGRLPRRCPLSVTLSPALRREQDAV